MLTYQDIEVGRVFQLEPYMVSKEEITEFAREFDPQSFHLSEKAGKSTHAGGLIASGWHTSSILMRMVCESWLNKSASQGAPGIREVRWKRPVRPGDVLTGTSTILSKRLSASRPRLGIFTALHQLSNQNGEPVMTLENTGMMSVEQTAWSGGT